MAQYIKSITYSNGATVNKVGSNVITLGYPLNITVNGETYTRDPDKLDPITSNISVLSNRNTTASSAVTWATNTATFRVTGAYGNFSSIYSATQNLPIQLSTGNSSDIYARMNLSSVGVANITFYCKGNTSKFSGNLVPLYISSTSESSDPINNGQTIQNSLVISFNVNHSIDKGYGIMLWGNSQSVYVDPNVGSVVPSDSTTVLGTIVNDATIKFPNRVVNEISDHESVEGALNAISGAGFKKGVVVFMPGMYKALDASESILHIMQLIDNGFDVIILDKPDLNTVDAIKYNYSDEISNAGRHLIFLEMYPNTPNTYQNFAYYGGFSSYSAILSNTQDPSYLNTESSLQSRIVDFNLTESSGSWNDVLSNFYSTSEQYQSPPALPIVDITRPMYLTHTRLGSESEYPSTGFEGNVSPLPENVLFISNIGGAQELDLLSSGNSSAVLVNPDAVDNILDLVSLISTGSGSPNDLGCFQDSPVQSWEDPGALFAFIQPLTVGQLFDNGLLSLDWGSTDVNTDNPFLYSV